MRSYELRQKTRDELRRYLEDIEKEYFNLRMRRAAQELPNPKRLTMLRREIARVKTILREDELGLRELVKGGGSG